MSATDVIHARSGLRHPLALLDHVLATLCVLEQFCPILTDRARYCLDTRPRLKTSASAALLGDDVTSSPHATREWSVSYCRPQLSLTLPQSSSAFSQYCLGPSATSAYLPACEHSFRRLEFIGSPTSRELVLYNPRNTQYPEQTT
ncbi:hypothetical protein LIA77_07329 [Sarocladium implicatum]|nr:hypothetical protein LIA77_07329 [Sarocladium implicatum]